MAEHGSSFPETMEAVSGLPGVGRYTAGAILSIAFNKPMPVVDGNVRRVICRLQGIRRVPADRFFWQQAAAWIPPGRASDFNQAVMELGALVCTPTGPKCPVCPVRTLCDAASQGIQSTIPPPRSRPDAESITLAILLIEGGGRMLLSSRNALAFIPGKWGLPAVRVAGSTPPGNAAQELARGILGRTVVLAGPSKVRHAITRHRICAEVFRADGVATAGRLEAGSGYRWATRAAALRLVTSSLFRKAIRRR